MPVFPSRGRQSRQKSGTKIRGRDGQGAVGYSSGPDLMGG